MWGCGDIYYNPYTFCLRRQLMPILAAHVVVQQRIVAGVRLLPCIYCHRRQYKPKFAACIVVPSCRERETLYLSLDSWECSVYMVVFNRFDKNLNNHIYTRNVKFIHLLMYFLPTRRSRKAIFK